MHIPIFVTVFLSASLTGLIGTTVHSFPTVSLSLAATFICNDIDNRMLCFHGTSKEYPLRSLLLLRQPETSLFQMYARNDDLDGRKDEENDSKRVIFEASNVNDDNEQPTTAMIGTVNERLLAELQQAEALEKSGMGSTTNRNNRLMKAASFFKSSKTDEERKAAIAEAQDLNGVNPVVTLFGSFFALVCAAGLWYLTQSFATYFAMHPSDPSDAYFVVRVSAVSRNIVMGLAALASGFFGVTGCGILLLAIRVGWGVVTGELDPTPIPTSTTKTNANDASDKLNFSELWDLMRNKPPKRGR
jgi:Protein of unknown function (DUF3082)